MAVVRLTIQGKGKEARTFDVTLSSIPQSTRMPRVVSQDEDEGEEADGREDFTIGDIVPPVWRTAALDIAILVVASQYAQEFRDGKHRLEFPTFPPILFSVPSEG